MTKKKGQMEIIGLVFIVFLLAIGMLFLVFTTGKDNAKSTSLNPQDIELSQSIIDAIKNIKLDCPPTLGKKIGIDDLIQDMAGENRIICDGYNSEEYTTLAVSNILNATLGSMSKPYYFSIIKNKNKPNAKEYSEISYMNCTADLEGRSGEQPFPLKNGAGTVTMSLFICK